MISFSEILKKDNRSLDENQTKAVMCNSNCVVSAGAGSGKTTVLSYRFLRLVCDHVSCDRILTLTFTEKAASEMKDRIYQRLLSCGDEGVLKSFEKATVSTIDSFCATVARTGCRAYGISPSFTIMEEEDYRKSVEDKVLSMVEMPRYRDAVDFISKNYSPDDVVDVLYKISRSCFKLTDSLDGSAAYSKAQSFFESILENANRKIEDIIKEYECLKVMPDYNSASEACKDYQSLLNFSFSRSRGSKEIAEAYKDFKAGFIQQRTLIGSALEALNASFGLKAFYGFLFDLRDSLLKEKRTSSRLLFEDVSDIALDILKTNKTIRDYFKGRFDYIMIDEFQDNNSKQKDLMYLLAEKPQEHCDGVPKPSGLVDGKLFFVGDQKQSIYLFRNADVSVFKSLSKELEACNGSFLNLETNYRSNSALIGRFNDFFSEAMRTENGGFNYEASFEGLKSGKKPSDNWSFKFAYLPYDENANEDDAKSIASEAEYVASLIESMLYTDDYLIPARDGSLVRPKPGDIAILYRSLTSQSYFEKSLRQRGIPVSLSESRAVFTDAIASDFYNMLQYCIYPQDKMALSAILGSPLCPLDERARYLVLQGEYKEDNPVFKAFLNSLDGLKAFIKTASLSQIVNYIWSDMGYRAHLEARESGQFFLGQYDFFLSYAVDMEKKGANLVQFLSWVRGLLGTTNKSREVDVFEEHTKGVQMMSIHKSKGLEFPIVFVSATGSKPNNHPDGFALIDGLYPLPNHINYKVGSKSPIRNLASYTNKHTKEDLEIAELKRLIYVAFTRAESHLVVTGCQNKLNREKDKGGAVALDYSVILNYMLRCFNDEKNTVIIKPVLQTDIYNHTRKAECLEQTLEWLSRPQKPEVEFKKATVAVTQASNAMNYNPKESLEELISDPYILENKLTDAFGTLAHKIIELKLKGLEAVDNLMHDFEGESEKLQKQIYEDAALLANNFLSSDLYKSLKGYGIQSEQRFFMAQGDVVLEGVADLVAIKDDDIVIVDFKTDRHFNPAMHKAQLELYKKAFKAGKAALCYLRKPEDITWF